MPVAAQIRRQYEARQHLLHHPRHAQTQAGGFPGDDASLVSLRRNGGALDWVVPATVTIGWLSGEAAIRRTRAKP